jgi:hypothetical protein
MSLHVTHSIGDIQTHVVLCYVTPCSCMSRMFTAERIYTSASVMRRRLHTHMTCTQDIAGVVSGQSITSAGYAIEPRHMRRFPVSPLVHFTSPEEDPFTSCTLDYCQTHQCQECGKFSITACLCMPTNARVFFGRYQCIRASC